MGAIASGLSFTLKSTDESKFEYDWSLIAQNTPMLIDKSANSADVIKVKMSLTKLVLEFKHCLVY